MSENRPPTLRRVGSSAPGPGQEPSVGQDATHGHTSGARHPGPPHAPCDRRRDALEMVRSGYIRLVEAHADMASAYEVLVEVSENELAGLAETSVTSGVPTTPTRNEAPEGRATPPDLLTTQDMVKLLQCGPRTLRRKELAGEIPTPIRTGRIKRWRRSDIDRWLEERAARVPRKGRLR